MTETVSGAAGAQADRALARALDRRATQWACGALAVALLVAAWRSALA